VTIRSAELISGEDKSVSELEEVTFDFTRIMVTITDDSGTTVTKCWNVQGNTAC
jgi:hypothetical protein